jgi:hypothetical protein
MKKYALVMMAIGMSIILGGASASDAFDPSSLPLHKDFYAEYFDFGSAVSSREIQNQANPLFFTAQYSIITLENELKPESVLYEYNAQKASPPGQ